MTSESKRRKMNIWLVIGVGVLVILLLVWLTIADLWGDTDVAASVMPVLANVNPANLVGV